MTLAELEGAERVEGEGDATEATVGDEVQAVQVERLKRGSE
jgi:hypothetical protein